MIKLKQQLSRISPLSVSLILIFAAAMSLLIFRSFAAVGPATLYTSPSGNQSVKKGSTFTTKIRVSTASNVQVAGAAVYMSYTSSKLSVQSVSYSGSSYTIEATPQSNSGGILHIERAALPAITGGDKLFATVTFKAIATGSAAVGFTSSSYVTSGDSGSSVSDLPLQTSGVIYNISSGSSVPKKPSSTTSTTSSTSEKNSTTSDSTQSTDSSSTSTTPTDSSSNDTSTTQSVDKSVVTQSTENSSASDSTGSLEVLVVDESQKPVQGAEVTVSGQTVKTNKDGIATFKDVPAGKNDLVVSYKGQKTFSSAQVKSYSTNADPESVTVSIKSNKFNPLIWLIIPLIGILVFSGFFFGKTWVSKIKGFFGQDTPNNINVKSSVAEPLKAATPKPSILQNRKTFTPGSTFSPAGSELAPPQNPVSNTPDANLPTKLPEGSLNQPPNGRPNNQAV